MLHFLVIISFVITRDAVLADVSSKITKPNSIERKETTDGYFTNTWAVRIIGGVRKAEGVANRLGYNLLKKISEGIPNVFLFINPEYPKKTNFSAESITTQLRQQSEISWVEQQFHETVEIKSRLGRRIKKKTTAFGISRNAPAQIGPSLRLENRNFSPRSALNFNDKLWPNQYYLKDRRDDYDGLARDINLAPVWLKHGLFGNGIKVIVIDTGVERKHLDLVDNFDPALGLDVMDNDKNADPSNHWWYPGVVRSVLAHGTRCAGIIGMKANNTICGVGVAPSVTLGAVRLLGLGSLTDYKTATALLFKHVQAHIMSNSWGARDDGKTMPRTGPLARAALKIGVTKGRGGRGIIYTFAAGNGKRVGDNCGCDTYVSSIYTIPVAACNYRGKITRFSEQCPSVMVTAYAGNVAPDTGKDKCTIEFNGTSASTPVVSGAIALALEANPKLSWRDVQHLLAWTCQVAPLQLNPVDTWMKNGAGFYVSHDFGFGMLDVNGLVESAKSFQSVGAMNTCVTRATMNDPGNAGEMFCDRVKIEISTDGCENTPSEVVYLEHVQLTVSLGFPRRGDLKITLTSPSGTKAKLMTPRPLDSFDSGVRFWAFDSVMTWGESPKGKWTILIIGKKRNEAKTRFKSSVKRNWSVSKNTRDTQTSSFCYSTDDYALDDSMHLGEVNDLTLTFHGTSGSRQPEHYKAGPRSYRDFTLPKL